MIRDDVWYEIVATHSKWSLMKMDEVALRMSSQWHSVPGIKSVAGEKSKQIFLTALMQIPFHIQTYCAHSCSKLIRNKKWCVCGSTKSLELLKEKEKSNFNMLSEESRFNEGNIKILNMKLSNLFHMILISSSKSGCSDIAVYVRQCRMVMKCSPSCRHNRKIIKRSISIQQKVDLFSLFSF